MRNWREASIIGGGPAGAATGLLLARAGLKVRLHERSAAPHDKVCGDFLSWPALGQLSALGVCAVALGAAPIARVRLIQGPHIAEARLPFAAAGLTRRTLDEALLAAAGRQGAAIERGRAIRTPEPAGSGEAVVLATGKHDLRGWTRAGSEAGALGFKTYIDLTAAEQASLAGLIELILLPGGYAGLQMVEGGRASLCVMLRRPPPVAASSLPDWLATQSPHLNRRLSGARALLERPLAVARVPYGHLPPDGPDWLFRVGDQAAVIPSLAGDGVAIALRSAASAAEAVLLGNEADAHHRHLRSLLRRPVGRAMAAHRLALRPRMQPALVLACRAFPGLIRFTAALTRC